MHAINVGVNFTATAVAHHIQRRRDGHRGCVTAAAAKRGEITLRRDRLKASDHWNKPPVDFSVHTGAVNGVNAGVAKLAVAENFALIRVHATGAQAQIFQRDRGQRTACKFARGHQRIKLALGWLGGNFLGKFNQVIS